MVSKYPIVGLDNWNGLVSDTFCPMHCQPLDPKLASAFTGILSNTTLNRIQLTRIGSLPISVERRKQHIGQVSDAYYLVKFQLHGQSLISQRGRQVHLKPGDFVICSSNEPYQLHFPHDYFQAVLSVPQAVLRDMFHVPDDYLCIRMGAESPTHGLLSQFVSSLVQRMDLLEPAIVQRLEANLLDLLITSLYAEAGQTAKRELNAADRHLGRIKQFIAMHLKDPKLSPELIAQAEGISTRYLHILFKSEGLSVSRYIQQLRLDACHRALLNPDLQHVSATDIALDWGFGDVSHFYRCFKAQYQITPRQLRMQKR